MPYSRKENLNTKVSKKPEDCTIDDIKHKKKKAFLRAIYDTGGGIVVSAKKANISPMTHYNWLDSDPVYAHIYKQQQEKAVDTYIDEARRRAVEGVHEPVYQGGVLVGHKLRYSDRLLEKLLDQKDPSFRTNQPANNNLGIFSEGTVNIQFNIPRPPKAVPIDNPTPPNEDEIIDI